MVLTNFNPRDVTGEERGQPQMSLLSERDFCECERGAGECKKNFFYKSFKDALYEKVHQNQNPEVALEREN